MSHLSNLDSHSLGLGEDIVLAYYLGSTLRQVGATDRFRQTFRLFTEDDIARAFCGFTRALLANLSSQLLIENLFG